MLKRDPENLRTSHDKNKLTSVIISLNYKLLKLIIIMQKTK